MFTTLSAMVVACAMLLPNASVFAASYSQELQDAYNWAYSKSITTMSPIDNANMYGAITRAELAKMLANWAKDKGQTPDTSVACNFTDTASVKGDLAVAIVESCQLGLMGQGISAFRPYDTISRAEFGTALSRALWGNQYEGGTPYYAKHLDALKAAGIMTQIANAESTKEVRGYVMLMLMRSEGNEAVVDCDDPMTVIACTTDTDACPAACKNAEGGDNSDVVVKAGDLAVTANAAANRKIVVSDAAESVSDLDTLRFKTSEEVTISKIVLERYGYSDANAISGVRLEDQDGNVIAEAKGLTKDKVTLSLKKDYRTVDGTFDATIVVRMVSWAAAGQTVGFKVVDAVSTAKNLNLDDYTPYTYETVVYNGAALDIEMKGNVKDYNYEAGEKYEVARLKATAHTSTIYVKGFTLTNASGLDVREYLDKLTVTVAGKDVSGLKYSVNKDDELVVSFDDYAIEMNKNATFVVEASFAEDFDEYGETIAYYVESSEDVNAVEKKTGARVTVNGTPSASIAHTFAGGKIKIANNKLGGVDAAQGAEGVVVAEWNITITEPLSKVSFTIEAKDNTGVENMYFVVNGEEYEGTRTATTNGAKFKFNNVEIEKSGKVQFKIDVYDLDSVEWTVQFTTFNKDAFAGSKYDTTNKPVSTGDVAGSISFSKVTFQAAKWTLKNTLDKESIEYLYEETNRKVVFEGTYTAKKADVYLASFYMTGTKPVLSGNTITYYLSIDGEEVADTDMFNSKEDFADILVKAGKSVSVKLEAEVEAYGSTGTYEGIKLALGGHDVNDKDLTDAKAAIKTIKVKESGSITVSAGASKNTVLLKSSTANIAEFTVKPANGEEWVTLDSLNFTLSGGDASKLEVVVDWDDYEWNGGVITPDVTLDKDGVVVRVNLTESMTGAIELTLNKVNDKTQTRKFSKRYEEALVYIAAQEKQGDQTKFTIGVKLADDDTVVSDLQLWADNTLLTNAKLVGEFGNGEEIFDKNDQSSTKYITKIQYKYETAKGETGTVTIDKDTYGDYFKVWSDYARLFKATD